MLSSRQIKAYFIRFLTRKKTTIFEIKNTRNILFLRYDRIGDMVITTPVFRELKLAYPEINISVLASKLNRGVLVNNPYVDKIYTNHKNNLLGDLPTLLKLRKMKFDVCVEFDHSVIPHAIIRLRIIKPKKVISVFIDGRYGLLGKELEILDDIISAQPTDGLWDDGRTDISQLGLTYQELEEAMTNPNSPNRSKYLEKRKLNLHKMGPIPVCKIPN